MRADSLNEKISHRPAPEKLIQEGVLHEDPRSPEEKYEEAIEEEYAKREGGAWIKTDDDYLGMLLLGYTMIVRIRLDVKLYTAWDGFYEFIRCVS